jgi:hypothetical protein
MRTVFDEEIPLLAIGLEKALTQIAKGKEHEVQSSKLKVES